MKDEKLISCHAWSKIDESSLQLRLKINIMQLKTNINVNVIFKFNFKKLVKSIFKELNKN